MGASWLIDWKFWLMVGREAERTLVCSPEHAARVSQLVRERGMEHVFKVESSPACPPDQLLIIDHQAVEASIAEMLQHDRRAGFFRSH